MTTHMRPEFDSISNNPLGIVGVFQERPSKYMMLTSFAQEVLREVSYLSPTEREVIAAYTSALNGCEYCCGSHTALALSLGASDQDIKAINDDEIVGHQLETILSYVKKLTLTPNQVSDLDKKLVHEAGFSEDQLKDAIAVCAAFNLLNRIVEGHGIPPRDNYDADVSMINAHGYDRRY